MRNYYVATILIILIVFIRIFAGGYIGNLFPSHFENGKISFDYPSDWDLNKEVFNANDTYGNSEKVVIGKKSELLSDTRFALYAGSYNESYSLEDLKNMQQKTALNAGDKILFNKTILIDGTPAACIQTTNRDGFELLEITFTKDQTVYYYIVFSAEKIEYIQKDIDKIINSLHVN